MIKKVGILTSGGDAPGMNAAIRAVVRAGLEADLEMYVIFDGYKGIFDRNIQKVDRTFVSEIINRGGTKIGTARFPGMADPETQKEAARILRDEFQIDALVAIGGDGTYRGALALSRNGIKCVGLPGTIDNDIASSDYTIGFFTALQTIVDCVDKLRDTSSSHKRVSVIEVMGRYCGDLAVYASVATGADIVITRENPMTDLELFEQVKLQTQVEHKRHLIIIVTEHIYDVAELADRISKECGVEAKSEVLGRIQRGGIPSAMDRFYATAMGVKAIDELLLDKTGICIGLINNHIVSTPIEKALQMENNSNKEYKHVLVRSR